MMTRRHIAVIVLGDVGRSPRMQYHALSLLEHGYFVSLVGYEGEELIPQLEQANEWANNTTDGTDPKKVPLLQVLRFTPYAPPISLKKGLLPVYLILRVLGLLFSLCSAFAKLAMHGEQNVKVDCILVQNPPSIPLLLSTFIYCKYQSLSAHETGFVIDWHNLGYTMFDVSPNHPIRKIAKFYEKMLATRADCHMCVTDSMKKWLIANFGITNGNSITVLHDRPPDQFCPTTLEKQHDLMKRIQPQIMEQFNPGVAKTVLEKGFETDKTLLTQVHIEKDGSRRMVVPRDGRPIMIVSSTSWTPDENFSILLDALVLFDKKMSEIASSGHTKVSHYLVIVTGKGPQKTMYQKKIKELNLQNVSIVTLWLEASDYPTLLGCADLGVSLHVSTSGLDLPMKVLDMFGCEVPVCAVDFSCLGELVQDERNGRVFSSSDVLSRQLLELLADSERDEDGKMTGGLLEEYRERIKGMRRWRENWIENALPTILLACKNGEETGRNRNRIQETRMKER